MNHNIFFYLKATNRANFENHWSFTFVSNLFSQTCWFDHCIVHKIGQNKCSDTLSFTKKNWGLSEFLKHLHTHCERNINAYHKNT